jgi:hypothetical protein
MVAVKGIYKGGDMVRIDSSSLSLITEPYEVIVTFLQPAKTADRFDVNEAEKDQAKRTAGFQAFMKYKGRLPADFDYRKELADYRDERYGSPH